LCFDRVELSSGGWFFFRCSSFLSDNLCSHKSFFLFDQVFCSALVSLPPCLLEIFTHNSGWHPSYGDNSEKLIDPYLSNVQSHFLYICSLLSGAISGSPGPLSEAVLFALRNVVNKLADLGTTQFYMDDGESINKFNDLGKKLIIRTNMAIIELSHYNP
jgi:hypothetical protein